MTRSITSPNHLRDTQLLRTIAEMREADRIAPSGDEEPDENRHVCRTCARFTALDGCDLETLHRLHLRFDDIEAVMSDVGICCDNDDYEVCAPSLVLADNVTCGEWKGRGTCES